MTENKMGTMKENRLLLTMSLPIMLSMMIQAMYNIVDSLFVAQIGEDAIAALSLAFPIQNLIIAIGVGTAVGMNSLLSRYLGERNSKAANQVADNGVFLTILSYLPFLIFGLFFAETFYRTQTTNETIIAYGTSYIRICTLFAFGQLGQITVERLLQSTGKTMYSMYSQATGAIVNIILDPILIFGLFGFPALGVRGAAIATIIGQILGLMLGAYLNKTRNKEIHISIKEFRPCLTTIKSIYKVGFPAIIMQSIGSIMIFGLNKILISFTSTATAVLGIYSKLQSFVFMPVFGLTNGMIPIISYNYGAKRPDRINKVMKLSILYATGIMTAGFLVMELFPVTMLSFFDASDAMIEIGVPALRIISISFLAAGFGITASSIFQALGNGLLSLIASICRQLVILLPAAYILAKACGLHAVWWAFPISEIFSFLICIFFLVHAYKKEIKPLYSSDK